MAKKIDKDGVHLHGCTCKECTKNNVTCPACGRKYWTEPDDPQFECSRCCLHWDEGHPEKFLLWMAENPKSVELARSRGTLRESV